MFSLNNLHFSRAAVEILAKEQLLIECTYYVCLIVVMVYAGLYQCERSVPHIHGVTDTLHCVLLDKSLVPLYMMFHVLLYGCHSEYHRCIIIYSSCLLYTSPSPRDGLLSRMPSSA